MPRPNNILISTTDDERNTSMKRITDWCQVLGAITTAVGVWFAYSALQKTVQWNKLSGQYTFFSTQVLTEKEMAAANALERAGWNLHTQLTPLPDNIVATVLTNSTIGLLT